jgi:dephospho-CoA kinase
VLIAGLTGGMACGKSFVAEALRNLGAYIIEADELGHQAISPGGEAHAQVLAAFGETDRAKLAAIVFQMPDRLEKLNAIVHPAVRARARRLIEEIAAQDPHAVIVYVAAILIESGGLEGASKLIVVTCTREQQIARAMERPGASETSVLARLEHQLPVERKVAQADYVIETSGTKEETLRQTKLVFEELRRLAL